jgi:hypothetical protein
MFISHLLRAVPQRIVQASYTISLVMMKSGFISKLE